MSEIAVMLLFVHTTLGLGFSLGATIQTLPIPRHEWRAYGPLLMWDSIVGLFAVSSVSAVQLLMNWLSDLLNSSFGGPFSSSTASFALIISQLSLIDSALVLLVAAISSTVVLAPVAEIIARIVGPAVMWVTTAIILWSVLELVISLFPRVWLFLYVLGLCFFVIPFRIGRSAGAYLMSASIVVAIALPILPSLAIALQGTIGYETSLRILTDSVSEMTTNPLKILLLTATFPSMLAGLVAAVIIALIAFPIAYLFLLSLIIRSISNLMGGSSFGPGPSSFVLGPSKQIAREVTR